MHMLKVQQHLTHVSTQCSRTCTHIDALHKYILPLGVILLTLVGCGSKTSQQPGNLPPVARATKEQAANVSFTSSTSYEYALRTITALGLHPSQPCLGTEVNEKGEVTVALPWVPVGGKDFFVTTHGTNVHGQIGATPTVEETTELPSLWVISTPLAPSDWQTRLQATAGVTKVDTHGVVHCPAITHPSPRTIISLPPQQAGTYVKVTFSPTVVNYDNALYIVSNLGFRLANPCYEQEKGKPDDWHPMGQEALFTETRTLVVATASVTPADWQTRLPHTSGVASVAAPYKGNC